MRGSEPHRCHIRYRISTLHSEVRDRLRKQTHDALNMKTRAKTLWPSGLRRWLKAPVRKGVGSNPTGVMFKTCASKAAAQNWCVGHRMCVCCCSFVCFGLRGCVARAVLAIPSFVVAVVVVVVVYVVAAILITNQ